MTPPPPADVVVVVDDDVLRQHPLPDPDDRTSKNERGRVLVIGGTAETLGAVILAGVAALRVGAGKLQLATVPDAQQVVAGAVPEARVIAPHDAHDAVEAVNRSDATVLGVGMLSEPALRDPILEHLDGPVLVIDAGALSGYDRRATPRTILVPNPDEMEDLLGEPFDDPAEAVRTLSGRYEVTVALRGPETWITAPGEPVYRFRGGHPGLATSGSGDVLAGAVGGLAARGADPLAAVLHGVAAHGRAGRRLAERIGRLGFLARELLDELPVALDETRNSR